MVDIAMCRRRDCTSKHTCFRYLAFPSEYQTYLTIDLQDANKETCEYYWRCTSPKELAKLNRINE